MPVILESKLAQDDREAHEETCKSMRKFSNASPPMLLIWRLLHFTSGTAWPCDNLRLQARILRPNSNPADLEYSG